MGWERLPALLQYSFLPAFLECIYLTFHKELAKLEEVSLQEAIPLNFFLEEVNFVEKYHQSFDCSKVPAHRISIVDIEKSHEDPHNEYNKDIVVVNLVKFVENYCQSFDCNTVPAHRISIINIEKSHEDPHSEYNKDIVVENLVMFVKNYCQSFDCNTVPAHRQAGLVVDNRNHNEHRFHITHKNTSGVVEGG
ncbi:hypothetical protein Tco_0908000 [Tanacetum coccineum]|uniref:Uncharacterized protein n=1 Tax=Tanacetum coccineum TaxID=301880 RepID=A0ABQ5CL33_9ASTR